MEPEKHDILSNIEAEQVLLGSLLLHNDWLGEADLRAEHLADPTHRFILRAITDRIGEGRTASAVSLKAVVEGDAGVQALGGAGYLARMTGVGYSERMRKPFLDLVQEIKDLWARRTMLDALAEAQKEIGTFEPGERPQSAISRLEANIAEVTNITAAKPLTRSWLSAQTGALSQISQAFQGGGVVGTPTGLKTLDDQIGGFAPGDMIVLAGRPSMGKTAIALSLAWRVAEARRAVFFASLEMPGEQLVPRFVSSKLHERGKEIPYFDIRTGRISEETLYEVGKVMREFQDLPVILGEKECRSMIRLRSAARQAHARALEWGMPLGLIVIDFLQLLEDPTAKSDYQRVSNASGMVKALGMDLGCPVIVLSQLNRQVEQRDPPVPRLSDLRESGRVEEDADVVMLAYRPEYYLIKERETLRSDDHDAMADLEAAITAVRGRLDLLIPKARGGPTGKASVMYSAATNYIWEAKP